MAGVIKVGAIYTGLVPLMNFLPGPRRMSIPHNYEIFYSIQLTGGTIFFAEVIVILGRKYFYLKIQEYIEKIKKTTWKRIEKPK
jgi:hypothetical protein